MAFGLIGMLLTIVFVINSCTVDGHEVCMKQCSGKLRKFEEKYLFFLKETTCYCYRSYDGTIHLL